MASDFRQTPGPEVVVTANAPAYDAPIAVAQPAISSSHCTVVTPNDLCLESSCSTSVAGVIGIRTLGTELQSGFLCSCDESVGCRFVSRDIHVFSGIGCLLLSILYVCATEACVL